MKGYRGTYRTQISRNAPGQHGQIISGLITKCFYPHQSHCCQCLRVKGENKCNLIQAKKKKKKVKSPLSHLLHNSMSSSPLGSSSLPGCGAVNFSEHSKTLNYSIRPAASEAMLIHIAAKESTSSSGPAVRIRVSASSQKDPKTLNSALFDLNREAAGQRRERCFPSPGLGWPNSAPLRQKRPDPGHPKFYCWTPRRTHPWERGRTSQDFP